MTTWKTIALTRRTFLGKVMSLLLNMLSRLVITFLPRSKRLLISWLQWFHHLQWFCSPYTYSQLIYDKGGKIIECWLERRSLRNGSGNTGQSHVKKIKFYHSLTLYTKISSKWIKGLNVRQDSIKLLEENIEHSSDINQSNIFFDSSSRIKEIRT